MSDEKEPDGKSDTIGMREALRLSRETMRSFEQHAAMSQQIIRQIKLVTSPANDLFKVNAAFVKIAEDGKRMAAMIDRLVPRGGLFTGLDFGRATQALGNVNQFQIEMSKELGHLTRSFSGIPASPAMSVFRDQLRILDTPYYRDLAQTLQRSADKLRPFGEVFAKLREEERVAAVILELGIVPHGELWTHFTDIGGSGEDKTTLAVRLAHDCWEPLKQSIDLDVAGCMGDAKLAKLYLDMLRAHGHGLYELVRAGMPGALERALRVTYAPDEPPKIDYWIRQEISELPLGLLGGMGGFRVWQILVKHTFAGFKSDDHADAIPFPNRHTAAHGGGRQVAGIIDSLNAILLTHFVILLARAQRDYRIQPVASSEILSA